MGNDASSSSYPFGRFTGTRHGIVYVCTHCKIPWLQSNHRVSCPSPNVCYTHYISFIRNSWSVPLLGFPEPNGSCCRNIPVCFARQRFFFASPPHLFRNSCSLYFVIWHVLFQADGETRCRLSVIYGFLSCCRSYQSFQKIPFGNYRNEQSPGWPQSLVG